MRGWLPLRHSRASGNPVAPPSLDARVRHTPSSPPRKRGSRSSGNDGMPASAGMTNCTAGGWMPASAGMTNAPVAPLRHSRGTCPRESGERESSWPARAWMPACAGMTNCAARGRMPASAGMNARVAPSPSFPRKRESSWPAQPGCPPPPHSLVTPAKAGVQKQRKRRDARLRGHDGLYGRGPDARVRRHECAGGSPPSFPRNLSPRKRGAGIQLADPAQPGCPRARA
jgi:hypothetical protein